MTQEEKQLLLKTLCEMLPYGVQAQVHGHVNPLQILGITKLHKGTWAWKKGSYIVSFWNDTCSIETIKPYLRPMSSMTEKEQRELQSFFPGSFGSQWLDIEKGTIEIFECPSTITLYLNDSKRVIDFFNSHHIDYLGFIEDGLALEAPEGMYKTI